MGMIINPYNFSAAPLLLDTYTGAAAAYSLRKLRTAYTGYCIEVRRSSDDTTANIGFVNGVLDESALTTFVGAGDGFVKTWYDQSGNNANAVQTTTTRQPKIVSSGVVITANNLPALLGVLKGGLNITSIASGSVSIFTVIKSTGSALEVFGSNNKICLLYYSDSSGYLRRYSGQWATDLKYNKYNTLLLYYSFWNGSSSREGINGGSLETFNPGTNLMPENQFGIMWYYNNTSTSFTDGYMSETIIYSADKESDYTGISNSVKTYYSLV